MSPILNSSILVIDDTPANLHIIVQLLSEKGFRVLIAEDGEEGIERAQLSLPDLILLDVMMPGIDGFETCRRLKADRLTTDIPIIFLTALAQAEHKVLSFAVGGSDYVTKPIHHEELLARINTHLENYQAKKILQGENNFLEAEVARRVEQIHKLRDVTIECMAMLAEARDNETGNHIRRTQHYVKILAFALRTHAKFTAVLTDEAIEILYKSAPLHDIGKIGIPDAILRKPGKLTVDEFEIMKTHTTIGRDAIMNAERLFGAPNSFLQFAREIAYSHQEKWDGSGYPQGLSGDSIPISARLMAVADVFDALISKRVYKPAFPYHEATQIILDGSGRHFDPDVVEAFSRIKDVFYEIAEQFKD